eukprot:scaffold258431_cov37-Tisochrysis_lutea.AAC.2
MEPVTDARSESLFLISGVAIAPGCTRSTAARSMRKPRTAPASASARAHTSSTSAIGAFVIQVFDPVSTHSRAAGSHRARASMCDGSEPWLGSVNAKQPTTSPLASRGSHSAFCSSDPKMAIGCIRRELWTDIALR